MAERGSEAWRWNISDGRRVAKQRRESEALTVEEYAQKLGVFPGIEDRGEEAREVALTRKIIWDGDGPPEQRYVGRSRKAKGGSRLPSRLEVDG